MNKTEYYRNIRADLHRHPGVSGDEEYAHDLIVGELKKLHPKELYIHVGGWGVVAVWPSTRQDAKTLAFRADIDALPSGHRCGHDGHTAILLRFAQMVAADNDRRNNIVLIFQPEEETGKGAKKIMQIGILQRLGVDAIFGLHNLPGYDKGTVVLSRGTFAAASCGVIYRFIGRQTHASTPENGVNPDLAIAQMIECMAEQNRVNSKNFKLSTLICCKIGDETFGTAAGEGEVMFTLRSSTSQGMIELMKVADTKAIELSESYGLKLEKQMREPFKAVENSPDIADRMALLFAAKCRTKILTSPMRWSEDFAEYLKEFRGVFFGLGSGRNQPGLHSPDYVFPDDIIEAGAKSFETIMNGINL